MVAIEFKWVVGRMIHYVFQSSKNQKSAREDVDVLYVHKGGPGH